MNSLQDLVVGANPEPKEVSLLPPLQIFETGALLDLDDLEDLFRGLADKIRVAPSNQVPYLVAQATNYIRPLSYSRSQKEQRAILLAITYAHEPQALLLRQLLEWIEDALSWIADEKIIRAEMATIGNGSDQIAFLEEFFGESLPQELADIFSLRIATTRGWVRSHFSTSWPRHNRVHELAKIFFYLSFVHGLSRQEALAAYRAPWRGGSSPAEMIRSGASSRQFSKFIEEITSNEGPGQARRSARVSFLGK
jgi:hypothetical protein